jgi:hypothetical protein
VSQNSAANSSVSNMDLSQTSRHNSPSNCSAFSASESDLVDAVNFNSEIFLDTFKIKEERDVCVSCDLQKTNNDTNLQQIKLEPQFCITYEDELVEEDYNPPGLM